MVWEVTSLQMAMYLLVSIRMVNQMEKVNINGRTVQLTLGTLLRARKMGLVGGRKTTRLTVIRMRGVSWMT